MKYAYYLIISFGGLSGFLQLAVGMHVCDAAGDELARIHWQSATARSESEMPAESVKNKSANQ